MNHQSSKTSEDTYLHSINRILVEQLEKEKEESQKRGEEVKVLKGRTEELEKSLKRKQDDLTEILNDNSLNKRVKMMITNVIKGDHVYTNQLLSSDGNTYNSISERRINSGELIEEEETLRSKNHIKMKEYDGRPRVCRICNEEKDFKEFIRSDKKTGMQCRPCRVKIHYENRKLKQLGKSLKGKQYDIGNAEYDNSKSLDDSSSENSNESDGRVMVVDENSTSSMKQKTKRIRRRKEEKPRICKVCNEEKDFKEFIREDEKTGMHCKPCRLKLNCERKRLKRELK